MRGRARGCAGRHLAAARLLLPVVDFLVGAGAAVVAVAAVMVVAVAGTGCDQRAVLHRCRSGSGAPTCSFMRAVPVWRGRAPAGCLWGSCVAVAAIHGHRRRLLAAHALRGLLRLTFLSL